MSTTPLVKGLFLAALALIAGCAAESYNGAGYSAAADTEGAGYSAPASQPQPAVDQGAPKEEKRGNTPIGKDRTGAGPADGAILDPKGVVTKKPVLREQLQQQQQ